MSLREEVERLVALWHKEASGPIDSAREHGIRDTFAHCADELERMLAETEGDDD